MGLIKESPQDHFEHQPRSPGDSTAIDREVFTVLSDKVKIWHLGQVFQKAGAAEQNLLAEKISAKEPLA
jgi:hypothetical protein